MTISENRINPFAKFGYIAAFVALIGLGDSIYLTVQHYTAAPVPCSIVAGCETVLSSSYATLAGIPLSVFGIIAYFIAFILAILTIYGKSKAWLLFGLQTILMAFFTGWLLYLQGFVIGAFCQFCLLSAASTFTLFIIAAGSKFWRSR
ncbi:MAG: vitamin K epoxide reductase family protein [Pyrinomonadaceae bacterium]